MPLFTPQATAAGACVHIWKNTGTRHLKNVIPKTPGCLHTFIKIKIWLYRVRTVGGVTLIMGLCLRCLRVSGAAVKPMVKCCAQCRRVPRRNVWTPCTNLISAAPSAKTVGGAPIGTVWLAVPATLLMKVEYWACMISIVMPGSCHIHRSSVVMGVGAGETCCLPRHFCFCVSTLCLSALCFIDVMKFGGENSILPRWRVTYFNLTSFVLAKLFLFPRQIKHVCWAHLLFITKWIKAET